MPRLAGIGRDISAATTVLAHERWSTAESGEVVSAAMYNSGSTVSASDQSLNMTDVTFAARTVSALIYSC
jgi:hypothetical protein